MPARMITNRRTILKASAGLAGASLLPISAWAQGDTYPDGPLSVVIPTGEGGGVDRYGRTFAGVWEDHIGTNFEFEYFPGAAGQIGYETFMQREPDGRTLMLSSVGPEAIMLALQDPGIRIGEDIVYLYRIQNEPIALWVSANSEFQTLEQLIEAGQQRRVNISVSRLPHPASIGALILADAVGADFNLVPYGGGNPASMAAITGEVDACSIPLSLPLTFGEEARILGVFANENPVPEASGNAPTVNAVIDGDLPELSASLAWVVHRDMIDAYPDRVAILEETIAAAVRDESYVAAMEGLGVPPAFIRPGDRSVAMADAESSYALASQYRDVLTGQ